MAWSTRQLADLAGTTLKTVRHYHKVGLLPEPERETNGYKQYGVAHLVRLLRIRRLTDLGVSLPQIAAMGEADEHPEEALRVLDAELAATIERLQRVRAELGIMMRQSLPTDLPPELAAGVGDLSPADRALMVVYGRVLSPEGLEAMRRLLADQTRQPIDTELDELPGDAPEPTRADLAARMLPDVRDLLARHPDAAGHVQGGGFDRPLRETIGLAMTDLYNPAQLDVLQRIGALLAAEKQQTEDQPTDEEQTDEQRRGQQ